MSLKLRQRTRPPSGPTGIPLAEQPGPAGSAPAAAGAEPVRRAERLWPAATGLVLGLLALGPALGRGFVLSYDMVFVPAPPVSFADLGVGGGPPRAVPSDLVVAIAARIIPAEFVEKLILIAIFVLACSGAAALLATGWSAVRAQGRLPVLALLVAGVCYAWNPFVAERLIMGQWTLLLGYAGLPWVLREIRWRHGRVSAWRLAVAILPAAVGGFAAMSVTALAAVPVALCRAGSLGIRSPDAHPADGPGDPSADRHRAEGPGGRPADQHRAETGRERARRLMITLAVIAVASLPWVIPSLLHPVHADPAGATAFAARADTPFGALGSLLLLGGIWNAQAVPAGYGGAAAACWLAVVLLAGAGYAIAARRRRVCPGLGVAAVAGLCVAALGLTGPTVAALRAAIAFWPGFALLRDGQQFVAPVALALSVGLGAGVGALIAAARQPGSTCLVRGTRPAAGPAAVLGAVALAAPLVALPGLAWGAAGRLHAVQYPADWLRARQVIEADGQAGSVLLLPWAEYRRYPWNDGEAVFDPWPRFIARPMIWNDALRVGRTTVAPESERARRLSPVITSPGPLKRALTAAGVRYVIVDAGPLLRRDRERIGRLAELARLPGARVVLASPDLLVFRLPR
jgi:hypothetical protein